MDTHTYRTSRSRQGVVSLPPDLHLGRLIEQRLEEVGMTKAEFGRRIETSRQNVNSLIRKAVPDMVALWRSSVVLQFDLFAEASRHLQLAEPACKPADTPSPELAPMPEALQRELIRIAFAITNSAVQGGMLPALAPTTYTIPHP